MNLRYEQYESWLMAGVRGVVGIVGLAVLLMSALVAQSHSVTDQVLAERSVENRARIQALELSAANVNERLVKMETELAIARRTAESTNTLMQGLMVGVGLILVERAFVFIGYAMRRTKDRE